jgi:cobalamin biosynthetic protein CobC
MAIKHGGNLLQMARHYQSDVNDWIDLSTGVSPFTYPAGVLPESVWNQLPQTDDGLELAAKQYYNGSVEPVAVAGSQAAIMALPSLLSDSLGKCGTVALPRVGYKEHQHAWRSFSKNGQNWSIIFYDSLPTDAQIAQSDVVVVINPNNPSGQFYPRERLLQLRDKFATHNGTLIVDEAFVDVTPQSSVLSLSEQLANLIVLRSVGKFFGLAGARVGFVFAEAGIKERLEEYIGPWTVAGPSRWLLKQVLSDKQWQQSNRECIKQASTRLEKLLTTYLPFTMTGSYLFKTVYIDNAPKFHDLLCKEQVLTRLCDEKNAIRFGLPADDSQWKKLETVLCKLGKGKGE